MIVIIMEIVLIRQKKVSLRIVIIASNGEETRFEEI